MDSNDARGVSALTRTVMLDAWGKYEKGYYPKRAVDFDISHHSVDHYVDLVKAEASFAYVAVETGKVAGVAEGTIFGASGLARLGWLGVHPGHQRKGIGKALLEKVVAHCRAAKCHKITLYTLPVLIPAVNLYLRLGFVPEAYLRREWWGVDFIKMSKWI